MALSLLWWANSSSSGEKFTALKPSPNCFLLFALSNLLRWNVNHAPFSSHYRWVVLWVGAWAFFSAYSMETLLMWPIHEWLRSILGVSAVFWRKRLSTQTSCSYVLPVHECDYLRRSSCNSKLLWAERIDAAKGCHGCGCPSTVMSQLMSHQYSNSCLLGTCPWPLML